MKIDQQFIKSLLIAFEDSVGPDTTLAEMKDAGFDPESPEFIFHMRLLGDNDLIIRADGGEEKNFYTSVKTGYNGSVTFTIPVPMRLTAKGHDFIADLRQKEVWNTVSTNLKEASLSTLMDISKSLAQAFAKQKLKSITGIDLS